MNLEGALPASLKSVHFGQSFRKSLSHVHWPDNLEEISLSSSFSEPLREVSLPQGFRRLTLTGNHVGQLDAAKWPPNITTIHLSGEFNQPIDTVVWPMSLQQLSFGFHFSQPVGEIVWPPNLKELSFGGSFVQQAESVVLPDRLESLAFLHNSSQPIQRLALPTSLKIPTVGRRLLEEARSCVLQGVNISSYEFYSLWSFFRAYFKYMLCASRPICEYDAPLPSCNYKGSTRVSLPPSRYWEDVSLSAQFSPPGRVCGTQHKSWGLVRSELVTRFDCCSKPLLVAVKPIYCFGVELQFRDFGIGYLIDDR